MRTVRRYAFFGFAVLVLLMLAFQTPVKANHVETRCELLVNALNAQRSPNVRLQALLCRIAHARATQNAAGYKGPNGDGHNIAYVVRKLNESGICWRNVGEAIAWSTRTPPSATHFIAIWKASPNHWPMLSASRYDRAGGSWHAATVGDLRRTYAVMVVLNTC